MYVHCHHGKHRGPAAAACVLLALDPTLHAATSGGVAEPGRHRPPLHGAGRPAADAAAADAADLDALPADFPSVAAVPDLTRLMVAIDDRWDHLKAVKAAGWKAPPDHPDIDPPHEALQLPELYREAGRMPDVTRARRGVPGTAPGSRRQAAGELEKALPGECRRGAGGVRAVAGALREVPREVPGLMPMGCQAVLDRGRIRN